MHTLVTSAKGVDDARSRDTLSVFHSKIYYPVNKIRIYEDYMTNSTELVNIKRRLAASNRIDSITIYSYASPEGKFKFNEWLAAERGKTLKRFILENMPDSLEFPDSLIRLNPTAENWEGMREEIVLKYNRPDKAKILEIIDMEGVSDAQRKRMLRRWEEGYSWLYILDNIMPQLRYAMKITVWGPAQLDMPELTLQGPDSLVMKPLEMNVPKIYVKPVAGEDVKTILALKSNLLYDLVSWVNYSIEVPFGGDRFSALYYHQFPWWRWGESNNKYCVRFLGIGGEARWWFKPEPRAATVNLRKRDRLVGHFVGLYGESGKYDFERKRDICYQGEYWSVGLSYGYSMPISKRMNLELSVSGGYASIAHRGYNPSPDYSILWRDHDKIGRWHYWGLTKAQVTLVMPIMVKVRKGGSR
jgi:hypothetical protein